jgi:phage-related protein
MQFIIERKFEMNVLRSKKKQRILRILHYITIFTPNTTCVHYMAKKTKKKIQIPQQLIGPMELSTRSAEIALYNAIN